MKTLVIHPYDKDTLFMKQIYKDLDCTVIDENVTDTYLKQKIEEYDRIILLGSGTSYGMYGYNRFMINCTLVETLRKKEVCYIWNNSNCFVKKYGLNGLNTAMILSTHRSASLWVDYVDAEMLNEANDIFCNYVKTFIEKGVVIVNDSISNQIARYNNDNLIYS